MRNNETSTLDRLAAADPALTVTEDELARSREKSLAVMATDAEQLAVGGSIHDFHRRSAGRRGRLTAGFGLVAAAGLVGVFVASSMPPPVMEQAGPATTQSAAAPEADSSGPPPLPEITGAQPTYGAEIITGGNGKKVAVSTDKVFDFQMDALNAGKLGLNSGGCFAGIGPNGTSEGLIFPHGTRVTDTGIVLPDGTAVNIGDDFAFGGGLSPGSGDLGECSPNGESFLVQSWGFQS
ncbi:hypothetical protein ABIE37_003269 [Arthrobacter bambusae]|uniref:Uncharacterized protein n=1 Tax=Arthrobacter bambusae TaxID=1338426 RepID=A0ABV2P9P1_9MICC